MRKILFTIYLLSCFIASAEAQSWRWGKRGGSAAGNPNAPDETVVDMATDQRGNIYVLSKVLQTNLNVDGHAKTGWGGQDIMISSFNCNGDYRWSKVIGGSSDNDQPRAIKTDTLGGVYVTGVVTGYTGYGPAHFDADTSLTTNKDLFIIKYDTTGNYKWLRMPQPDTASAGAAYNTYPYDMDVDAAGNSYTFCILSPGAYAGGAFVAGAVGFYVIKYNSAGLYQDVIPMQISISGNQPRNLCMARDHLKDRYYITGVLASFGGSLYFNGSQITQPVFAGCFSSSGSLLWQKTSHNAPEGGGFIRPATDQNSNVYLAGLAGAVDTFNTYAITNALDNFDDCPFVVKLDTNGNNIWAKHASVNSLSFITNIVVNGSEADIAGAYPYKLVWQGGDSLYLTAGGYDVFISRFNASSGDFLSLDTLASTANYNEYPGGLAADKHGNLYIGGNFQGDLDVNGNTLITAGGGSDFFVAKYGYDNCGCTTTPLANFTAATTGSPSFNFSYTGTTTGLDSLGWDFGDGVNLIGSSTTISHIYTTPGSYYVCVTAYTTCGSNTHCDSVIVPVGIRNLSAFPGVVVYPNPATDNIFIAHASAGTRVSLLNLVGQLITESIVDNSNYTVQLSNIPSGTYLLQLADNKGNKAAMTIIKE